ncbi:MAG: VOC family protein [Bacteroides sp.]|nr:VOC family protein [Bacteroides sp.]
MNRLFSLLMLAFLFTGCKGPAENAESTASDEAPGFGISEAVQDTTPKITGIGGIFFFSDEPAKTRQWYADQLGLVTDDYGAVFEFRNANRPGEANYLRWSPFKTGSEYLAPSDKAFMINYRVQNIEGLVRQLKENGATVLGEIEIYPYGKFVYVMDPDGNKLELWEPVDSVLTQMGGKTNK